MSSVHSESSAAPAVESTTVERGMFVEMNAQRLEVKKQADGSAVVEHVKIQEADKVNRNGRVYPLPILQREVANMKGELARRPGAVDHPEGYAVPLQKLGLLWTDVYMEGNEVYGDFKILGTSAGKDLEALISGGVEVGISSRGFGTSKRGQFEGQDALIIQEDFELVTFDAVTDPSVFDARIPARSIESFDINSLLANEELVRELTKLVAKNLEETSMSDKNQAATTEEVSAETTQADESAGAVAGDAAVLAVSVATENPLDKEEVKAATTTSENGETMVMATPQESAPASEEPNAEAGETPAESEEGTEEAAAPEGESVEESTEQCSVCESVCEAVWTTKYVDSLPDSSFAVPSQRKLPYKDAQGNLDKAHIRNALARLDQTQGLSDSEKSAARSTLMNAAKKVGIDVNSDEAFRFALQMVSESLKNYEPVRQAIMAISSLISQEMAEGDFCDVIMLAGLADQLNHWADWEAIEGEFGDDGDSIFPAVDMESLTKSTTGVVEAVTSVVRAVSKQSVEGYLAKKIESEKPKYANKVAVLLQDCKTKAEIDAKFEGAVATAAKLFEDIEPAGKGVTEDPVPTRRETRLSENARLAQMGHVTK